MADKLNVVAVCGSLRKGSFNRMLMNASIALAPEGMAIKEAPSFGGIPIYNFDDQQARLSRLGERLVRRDPRRRRAAVRVPGIQLVDPGRAEERHRLGFAPQGACRSRTSRGGAVGGRRPARRRAHAARDAHALTSIDVLWFGRPEVIVTFAAQKFDERRRAGGSDRDRPDQGAARRVREVRPQGEREGR